MLLHPCLALVLWALGLPGQAGPVALRPVNGSGSFASLATYSTDLDPFEVSLADLHGDGLLDVVTHNPTPSTVSALLGLGGGAFGSPKNSAIGMDATQLVLASADSDAGLDLVVANAAGIAMFRNLCPPVCPSPAVAASYGVGKPGMNGIPSLASNPPQVGAAVTISLTNGLPGASPILLAGLTPASLPFDGGTLLVIPTLTLALPPFNPAAEVSVPINMPAGSSFCGLTLSMQALFVDPGAGGFYHAALSNGLMWTIGN